MAQRLLAHMHTWTLWIELRETLKRRLRALRRALRLSPIQQVCQELRRRGVRLHEAHALEVFGFTGELHTMDYAPYVSALEIWEIDAACAAPLRRNLPQARVMIVDTYEEITRTTERFDVIVVDNPEHVYGPYCEHFELFPLLFRVAKDAAVIILNVIPRLDDEVRKEWPYLFVEHDIATHLERRRAFYRTATPERVSYDEMAAAYGDLARAHGFDLEWSLARRRGSRRDFVYYLALKVRKVRRI